MLEQEKERLLRVPGSAEVTVLVRYDDLRHFHSVALSSISMFQLRSVLALFSGGLLPHGRKDDPQAPVV